VICPWSSFRVNHVEKGQLLVGIQEFIRQILLDSKAMRKHAGRERSENIGGDGDFKQSRFPGDKKDGARCIRLSAGDSPLVEGVSKGSLTIG
jgi:hypothetical protein